MVQEVSMSPFWRGIAGLGAVVLGLNAVCWLPAAAEEQTEALTPPPVFSPQEKKGRSRFYTPQRRMTLEPPNSKEQSPIPSFKLPPSQTLKLLEEEKKRRARRISFATQRFTRERMFLVRYSVPSPGLASYNPLNLRIQILDPNGIPVKHARITLTATKPDNHLAYFRPPRSIQDLGRGAYLARGVLFGEPGVWKLKLTILGRGQSDQVAFYLKVP
jgi:hypothetical protein